MMDIRLEKGSLSCYALQVARFLCESKGILKQKEVMGMMSMKRPLYGNTFGP